MSRVELTVKYLRDTFPEVADSETYTDAYLGRFIILAEQFISSQNFRFKPSVRELAQGYMAMHLLTLSATDASGALKSDTGNAGRVVNSASIHDVSVQMQAVIASDAYEQWLQSTPYGMALLALLTANNPVGVYFVGNPRAFGVR